MSQDGHNLFESVGRAYRMRREVQQWLDANVGKGNCSFLDYGIYEGYDWYCHSLYTEFAIAFRDSSKAMLFKLTWS